MGPMTVMSSISVLSCSVDGEVTCPFGLTGHRKVAKTQKIVCLSYSLPS